MRARFTSAGTCLRGTDRVKMILGRIEHNVQERVFLSGSSQCRLGQVREGRPRGWAAFFFHDVPRTQQTSVPPWWVSRRLDPEEISGMWSRCPSSNESVANADSGRDLPMVGPTLFGASAKHPRHGRWLFSSGRPLRRTQRQGQPHDANPTPANSSPMKRIFGFRFSSGTLVLSVL